VTVGDKPLRAVSVDGDDPTEPFFVSLVGRQVVRRAVGTQPLAAVIALTRTVRPSIVRVRLW
jgi:hypothetical protein